jgi:hypothetical protein
MFYAAESICFTIKSISALRKAVADYGVHYGGYCKLWGLRVADLVYWAQDKQLFCRKLQLQPMAIPTNAPDVRGVFICSLGIPNAGIVQSFAGNRPISRPFQPEQ